MPPGTIEAAASAILHGAGQATTALAPGIVAISSHPTAEDANVLAKVQSISTTRYSPVLYGSFLYKKPSRR